MCYDSDSRKEFSLWHICLGENVQKMPENEKETDKSVSNSDVNAECAYTSRLVDLRRIELRSYKVRLRTLHA